MKCPNCQSNKIRKNGHRRGKQNYHCQECGRQFITQYTECGYSLEVKENCLKMYVNGLGFRAIERITGVNHNNVLGMIANHKLASAISDLGFYEFRRLLTYKCACYGGFVEVVDRWYPSSKLCQKCGEKHSGLKLKDRIFVCPVCGHTEGRDLQAAQNLAAAPSGAITNRIGSIRIKGASSKVFPIRGQASDACAPHDRGLVLADELG